MDTAYKAANLEPPAYSNNDHSSQPKRKDVNPDTVKHEQPRGDPNLHTEVYPSSSDLYNAGCDQGRGDSKPYAKGYPSPPDPYYAGYDQIPMSQTTSTSVTSPVVTQPTVKVIHKPTPPTNWTIPAILVCFFFWPTGIFAVMTAVKAQKHVRSGNMDEAIKANNIAKWLTIISLIIPFVIGGIVVCVVSIYNFTCGNNC